MADEHDDPGGDPIPGGRLDVPTLRTIAQRAATHPIVGGWAFAPSNLSPRLLRIHFDASAYPTDVLAARIDGRWFTTNDYSFHYLERHEADVKSYQCRWDRHPKTSAPRTHFHPPPDAGDAQPSSVDPHHLEVLFTVLDWVSERVERLHAEE